MEEAGDNLHSMWDKAKLECCYEEGLSGIDGFSGPGINGWVRHRKLFSEKND